MHGLLPAWIWLLAGDGLKNKGASKNLLSVLPLVTALVWGLGFVAQVKGSESIQPFFYNSVRNIIGAIALVPAVLFFDSDKDRPAVGCIRPAIICGIVLFVAQSLQQIGLGLTASSAKGGFLTSIYAVLVPFIEFFVYGRKIKKVLWVSITMSLFGLFLIFAGAGNVAEMLVVTKGDLTLLANSLMYAIHIIVIDRAIGKVRPLLFSLLQVLVVAVLSTIAAFIFETPGVQAIRSAAFPILYGALVSTAIGYTLQVFSQKNPNVILTSIMFSTEAMFAAIGGMIILGERLSATAIAGCLLIFASVIIAQVFSAGKADAND